jgi:hypothetical protein
MSDLDGLEGVFPNSLRWNANDGGLSVSTFAGERELQDVPLGQKATFVLDLATRERGYGLIKAGVFDMQLTPVGLPTPPRPGDKEYKPAVGMWCWCPQHGELRIETNATLFRQVLSRLWDECRSRPEAVAGLQPVIRFVDRVSVLVKSVGESFFKPVITIVGWVPRNEVPGWAAREPTVPPPAALPVLPAATTSEPPAPPLLVKEPAKARRHKAARSATKPSEDPSPFDDPIPFP